MDDFTLVLPDTLCNDGWVSGSVGPGTCSHHGGVDYNANSGGYSMPWGFLAVPIVMWVIVLIWWKH